MLGKEKGHNASLQIATFSSSHCSLLQSVNRVRKKGAPRWAAFKRVHQWARERFSDLERRPVRGPRSRTRARAGRPGGRRCPAAALRAPAGPAHPPAPAHASAVSAPSSATPHSQVPRPVPTPAEGSPRPRGPSDWTQGGASPSGLGRAPPCLGTGMSEGAGLKTEVVGGC